MLLNLESNNVLPCQLRKDGRFPYEENTIKTELTPTHTVSTIQHGRCNIASSNKNISQTPRGKICSILSHSCLEALSFVILKKTQPSLINRKRWQCSHILKRHEEKHVIAVSLLMLRYNSNHEKMAMFSQ